MTVRKIYAKLPTEQVNPATRRIDRVSIRQALRLINKEDHTPAKAVAAKLPSIEKAVKLLVASLKQKGRIFFIGAGTSGRLGVMEAAECPPTFNTPPAMVQAFMAGGRSSVFRSKEGAEDRGVDARRIINKKVRKNDVVVGIAASGITPFVRDGLSAAKKKKARTVLVTCHTHPPKRMADVVIALKTGPEVIAGSTRLKAATATKLVLNALTVTSMIQMGKVYENLMVDLQPKSKKLRARAINLVRRIKRVSYKKAQALLSQAGSVKNVIRG